MPRYGEARVVSAELTDIQPAEYRADMVIRFSDGPLVFAVVVEVQLAKDARKRFVWPAYVANLRARLECPVYLLVVTPDDAVARWAARAIHLGGPNWFTPCVLGPAGVPRLTDEEQARANPELAVLSAMAHGQEANIESAADIAMAALGGCAALDADRSRLYFDLIINSLSEAARQALRTMDTQKYEYQSDFARKYVAEGEMSGRVALIARLLTRRFGQLSAETRDRINAASIPELNAIGERLLTARTLQEALETA